MLLHIHTNSFLHTHTQIISSWAQQFNSQSVEFVHTHKKQVVTLQEYYPLSTLITWLNLQVVYGPLQCEGIGLSDGEGMERMWSYLRNFGKMTKEMRPSHRVDILVHALAYYGQKKKKNLVFYRSGSIRTLNVSGWD